MSGIVTATGLVKRYDKTLAVGGLDLDVAEGEIFGLVGPNGAGKTTTLRILATLLVPDRGDAEIAGASVRRNPNDVRRVLGFVPDSFGVYDDMKVWEYLDFFARCYGIPAERVIAVHDEIDIPFAALKLKIGGGEGGHNGLRDMSKALSTKDYYRVRVGVGRPPGRMDAASYVLKPFSSTEVKELPFLLDDAADAVEHLVENGLLEAQQKFHAR